SYLVLLIYDVTFPNPYSAATHFGGVTLEEDDKEEEEHLAPADSSAIPIVDPVPLAGDIEAFDTDESAPTPRPPQIRIPFAQTRLRRARKTVRSGSPLTRIISLVIFEENATKKKNHEGNTRHHNQSYHNCHITDQGVEAALVECDASRSRDGDNSHGLGTDERRQMPTQRECTYTVFLKCHPMNFNGTKGVVGLT
ncbi:hypothetical protein Tco_0283899, partial [Tanacetum coccineum]